MSTEFDQVNTKLTPSGIQRAVIAAAKKQKEEEAAKAAGQLSGAPLMATDPEKKGQQIFAAVLAAIVIAVVGYLVLQPRARHPESWQEATKIIADDKATASERDEAETFLMKKGLSSLKDTIKKIGSGK